MIRVTTTAVMMTWMAATGTGVIGQDLQIERTEPAAIRVSVETLAQHVGAVARDPVARRVVGDPLPAQREVDADRATQLVRHRVGW